MRRFLLTKLLRRGRLARPAMTLPAAALSDVTLPAAALSDVTLPAAALSGVPGAVAA